MPQEKIRPLTSLDHPQSPFYDPEGGAITPVARLVVERIARKVSLVLNQSVLIANDGIMIISSDGSIYSDGHHSLCVTDNQALISFFDILAIFVPCYTLVSYLLLIDYIPH